MPAEKDIREKIVKNILSQAKKNKSLQKTKDMVQALKSMTNISSHEIEAIEKEARRVFAEQERKKKTVLSAIASLMILLMLMGLAYWILNYQKINRKNKIVSNGLFTTALVTDDDGNKNPKDQIEKISIKQAKFFIFVRSNHFYPGEKYNWRCEFFDGDGNIMFSLSEDYTAQGQTWNNWCYYSFYGQETPGTWRVKGYIDALETVDLSLEVTR